MAGTRHGAVRWLSEAGRAGWGMAGQARRTPLKYMRYAMMELKAVPGYGELSITAITKLKHADLWIAAKRLGSQRALADHLNVSEQELGKWMNLKAVPPQLSDINRKRTWSEASIVSLEAKLLALTGKSLEQLFPDELRHNIGFLQAPKQFEHTAAVAADALETYALNAQRRHMEHADPALIVEDRDDKRHIKKRLDAAISKLSDRERTVIQKRYGLGDEHPCNLDELAKSLSVTRERIRQIETRAMNRLRDPELSQYLVDVFDALS